MNDDDTGVIADDLTDEQSQEGFDDGFKPEAATATPRPGDEATPADDDQTDRAAAQEVAAPAAPEYVQLTKAQLEDLQTRAASIDSIKATQEKSFGTAFGKIGGLERVLQSAKRVQIPTETIGLLRSEIPELADALEQLNNLQVVGGGIDEAAVKAQVANAQTAIEQKFEMRLLSREHPDWKTVTVTDAFSAYTAALPEPERLALADSWDADLIGGHITKFKASQAKAAPRAPAPPAPDPGAARRSRMQAAVTPSGSGSAPAGPDPNDEFNAGFRGS